MTEEQIQHSIKQGKIKLSNWDKFTHYGVVIFLFFFPAMLAFFRIRDFIKGTPKPFKVIEIWFILIPLILGLLFYQLQKNRLKFKIAHTNLTRKEVKPNSSKGC